jgi:PAS domain S-box-containing protein
MVVGKNAEDLVKRLGVDPMTPHLDMRAKALASEYELTWTVRGEERQFWVSGTPIFGARGACMGTLATVRDVTERNRMAKRLERYAKGLQELVEEQTQRLMQSEAEFRDLLMQMSEGFVTLDGVYRVQFANQRICSLLNVNPQALRGCEIFDFVDPADRVRLMDMLKAAGANTQIISHPEFSLVRSDGSLVPVVVAVAPVQTTPKETGVRLSLVVTDVSELKRMQHQLEIRAAELESANEELRAFGRAKDGFLSNVSHELKTPLSTINGYVEMLTSGSLGDLQGPQASALKVMERNLKRLAGLINEMIEFSRMEIRGVQLKKTLFSPGELARECAASIQPQALAKDISVSIFSPDDFSPVWGDREKMGQVLGIFLSNAVKFSHEGGMINIRVSEHSEHTLAFAVSDTGIGIDSAFQMRVFEKFFQVDASMTRRYEGAGIGLSIAKSIVEAHGGRIALESELNRGSTFTILLPGAVFDSYVSMENAKTCADLSVLIVVENGPFRKAVRAVLSQCGCKVIEAGNGYECARLVEETLPDAVIFNEILADSAGTNAVGQLRLNPATSSIPIIGLSGEDISKAPGAAGLLQDVHFVLKPFRADDLIGHLRQVCFGEGAPQPEPQAAPKKGSRILVVDSDADLLEWLALALERKNAPCHAAKDPIEGVAYAQKNHPDVIVLGLELSQAANQHALSLFRECETTKDTPICLLGARPTGETGAFQQGVVGILPKPFGVDDLLRTVEELRATSQV